MISNIVGYGDFARWVDSTIRNAQLNAATTPAHDVWVTPGAGAYDPGRVDRFEHPRPQPPVELRAGTRVTVDDQRGGRPGGTVVRTLEWHGNQPITYLVRLDDGSQARFNVKVVFPVPPPSEAQLRRFISHALDTSSSGENAGRLSKRELEAFVALAGNLADLSDGALGFVARELAAATAPSPSVTQGARGVAVAASYAVAAEVSRRFG